jgi:CheY-like chemotaxis protein
VQETILVVEDNPLNLELAVDLLEAHNFTVYHAPTAEQALRLARLLSPDLVLMDVGLPGLDGLAATQALRADPAIRHLTVVALTAHAMQGDETAALRAGCDGYLTKPINTRTFAAKVAAFIAAAKARLPETETSSNYAK